MVLATGRKPDREALELVKTVVPETYILGEAGRPGSILEAVLEGTMVGRRSRKPADPRRREGIKLGKTLMGKEEGE